MGLFGKQKAWKYCINMFVDWINLLIINYLNGRCLTLAKSEALLILKTPPGSLNLKRGFPSGGTFFYLTRPLLLGEAPPLPRPPLLRRGLQPVNREFGTSKQARAPKGVARDCLRNRVAII